MNPEFETAAFAIEKAIDFVMYADMNGPCNCDEFMDHIAAARKCLHLALKDIHLWDEKERRLRA